MNIHFFEEYPNQTNLNKLKLVKFKSVVYVATKSFKQFDNLRKKISKINPKIECAYWPLLKKSYWVSPFAYTEEIKALYNELLSNKQKKSLKVLLDLELPFIRKKLFLINLLSFFKNKKLIRKFFTDAKKLNIDILTAECASTSHFVQKKLEFFGISYPVRNHKKIVMLYSSMIPVKSIEFKIKDYIKLRSKQLKDNLQIALGTIATGVWGNEPILSLEQFETDLKFCKDNKIDTVVIFRLGGLNEDYVKIIKRFI